ncbi:MAG: PilZ domain-containing protein [Spirochaetales bacterium]|nr:PilZ domain-containing protein [Spirochaetales bacterium]
MAVVTSQQLNNYYAEYAEQDVTFTKDVIISLGLITKQVYIKFSGGQQACIIYSTSMKSAKILINLDPATMGIIKDQNNQVSVRFCFRNADRPSDHISFFIQSKITSMSLYKKESGLYLITCEYSQRPPDDLIHILGTMLEASIVAKKRREERVILTPDTLRKLGFASKNAALVIDNVPRNAIIRDISFCGMKVIILGNAKFLIGKTFNMGINMKDGKLLTLRGKIVRFEAVEGRKDICAIALEYEEKAIPMQYTLALNSYFHSVKSKPGKQESAQPDESSSKSQVASAQKGEASTRA